MADREFRWFFDGTQQSIQTLDRNVDLPPKYFRIGSVTTDAIFDEFRFTIGTYRWDSGFSVPTGEYLVDGTTKSLLHFNEDPLVEEVPAGYAWQIISPASIDLTTKKFGLGSGNSATGYFRTTSVILPNFDIGGSEFSIDFWVYFNTLPVPTGEWMLVAHTRVGAIPDDPQWWRISLKGDTVANHYLNFHHIGYGGGIDFFDIDTPVFSISTGVWHHIAFTAKTPVEGPTTGDKMRCEKWFSGQVFQGYYLGDK
jgi:hypothetical protein